MMDNVIVLHGLARSRCSMRHLTKALVKAGYQPINIGYASTRYPIETLAQEVIPRGLAQCKAQGKIHFVTHSMGGILVRYYLQQHRIATLGRVVMLAPPNHGSQWVDELKHCGLFRWVYGAAGLQLTTTADGLPQRLGAADFDVGIIAGSRNIKPWRRGLLPKPNDGTVTVASTRLAGMCDHLVLPVNHSFMMNNPAVIAQVLHYLAQGHFKT